MKDKRGLWHRHGWVAYLAVFIGVCGHASSEFVAKLIANNSTIGGPEISSSARRPSTRAFAGTSMLSRRINTHYRFALLEV